MKKVILSSTLALLVSFSLALDADAAKKNKKLLTGQVAKQKIEKVNEGITWHTSLRRAGQIAQNQGKMILWVQMIGKMDGAT